MAEAPARSRPNKLPAELTSFAGRRKQLSEVKRLLLVLDNCEHLLDSCALPAVSLLTQSRLLTLTGSGGASWRSHG